MERLWIWYGWLSIEILNGLTFADYVPATRPNGFCGGDMMVTPGSIIRLGK